MDVRPGGVRKHVIHGPDGANYPNEHVCLEVVRPERLVSSHSGHKEGGHQTLARLADYLPRVLNQEKTGAELFIERTFDAPRDLVFRAWSEAEQLAQWWGPKGFGLRIVKLDFRPGGIFHHCSTTPNSGPGGGAEIFGIFLYREIVPPERIEFLTAFADKDANVALIR
jgi:uncharacterized protein YndB with AHSA1/START domain